MKLGSLVDIQFVWYSIWLLFIPVGIRSANPKNSCNSNTCSSNSKRRSKRPSKRFHHRGGCILGVVGWSSSAWMLGMGSTWTGGSWLGWGGSLVRLDSYLARRPPLRSRPSFELGARVASCPAWIPLPFRIGPSACPLVESRRTWALKNLDTPFRFVRYQ